MIINASSLLLRRIADLCFPIICFGCGRSGGWLCGDCRQRLPLRVEQRCPNCQKRITPSGETCPSCSERNALAGIFAATHYRIPAISRAIHACKYRFLPGVSEPLADILADAIDRNGLLLPDLIIPVPLHPRRLRFRGFNQSALIAMKLAEQLAPGLDIPVPENLLLRRLHTRPQAKSSRKDRLRSLDKAFMLSPETKKTVSGKTVWLVDDVATTGATLEECAKTLRKAGARSVFGIVVAR